MSVETEDKVFYGPTSLADAIKWKSSHQDSHIFSSATDLGVQINKDRIAPQKKMSLNLIPELYEISVNDGLVHVGAKVSLTQLGEFFEDHAEEFSRFLHIFASPQIKNKGTLVGNIVNGSPIGDTLPVMLVLEAQLSLSGKQHRVVEMNKFYKGYKQMDLADDEIVTKVLIPLPKDEVFKAYKVSKRKDLDISAVNASFRLRLDQGKIADVKIAYGGVGPTVLRMPALESELIGKPFDEQTIEAASKKIKDEITPMSDVRGSAAYRYLLCENLLKSSIVKYRGAGVSKYNKMNTKSNPHDSGAGHVSGKSVFVDDIRPMAGELFAVIYTRSLLQDR